MSNQDDPSRPGPSDPPTTLPPQPNQLINKDHKFTPYYVTDEEAEKLPEHASTAYLSNNLKHPAEEFPVPRNKFPDSDPIMDARMEGGEKSGAMEGAGIKEVKDMSIAERRARDEKEFSSSPPDILTQGQKKRWTELLTELLAEEKPEEDHFNIRARAELRKLQKLAELAGGQQG